MCDCWKQDRTSEKKIFISFFLPIKMCFLFASAFFFWWNRTVELCTITFSLLTHNAASMPGFRRKEECRFMKRSWRRINDCQHCVERRNTESLKKNNWYCGWSFSDSYKIFYMSNEKSSDNKNIRKVLAM